MMTTGTMPSVLSSVIHLQRAFYFKPARPHFWGLVTGLAVGLEHTIGRLNALLRSHSHHTNDGEFLWRRSWDEAEVLRAITSSSSADSIARANPFT